MTSARMALRVSVNATLRHTGLVVNEGIRWSSPAVSEPDQTLKGPLGERLDGIEGSEHRERSIAEG